MPELIFKNELVRRAIRYMDEELAIEPDKDFSRLLDETSMRFNLGPADAMELERLFRERRKRG